MVDEFKEKDFRETIRLIIAKNDSLSLDVDRLQKEKKRLEEDLAGEAESTQKLRCQLEDDTRKFETRIGSLEATVQYSEIR